MSSAITACFLSGLASVIFELLLKNYSASLWVRNIQLSTVSLGIALVGAIAYDGHAIRHDGFFQGYNLIVVITILMQACGGILVAVVVKYADNILKGFATSLSVILSTAASVFIFGFVITTDFILGSVLVVLATYMYSLPDTITTPTMVLGGVAQAKSLDADEDIALDYLGGSESSTMNDSEDESQDGSHNKTSPQYCDEERLLLKGNT